jgi:hypothetical protein
LPGTQAFVQQLAAQIETMSVAEWETKIVKKLPAEFKGSLPTVEEIEAELTREDKK